MLTQCPNCETTFRVTSEILRVAQGQVRCGRCQTQFDALQRLIEERAPTAEEPIQHYRNGLATSKQAEPEPSIEVDERESHEEITMEGKRIEITGTYRVLDEVDDEGEPQMRQEVVEEWMEIDEDVDADEDAETPQGYVDVSDEAEAREFDELEDSRERLIGSLENPDVDDSAVRAERRPGIRGAIGPAPENVEDDSLLDLQRPYRRTPLIWKIFALPLVFALIAQMVHHNRAELARDPRLGEPLMKIYRALNLNLTPDWDLHAYEIKQWGVITDAAVPGTLKVRASLINRAAFPQPYPLLKLVLEDRWGDQVRAREFEPAEYLDRDVAADRLFTPDQQANATIDIVDPGADAEGFRFDVCLKGEAGSVCAAELRP